MKGASILRLHLGIASLCVGILLVFAALQFNDPDPFLWVGVYSLAAMTGILSITTRIHWGISAALALAYLIGGIVLWPEKFEGVTGNMASHPSIELARESLGLFIASFMLGYFVWIGYRRGKEKV